MDFTGLHLEKFDRFATITLGRPKVNALSLELLRELDGALTICEQDDAVRAVVVTGGQGKFFSGGADIPELRGILDAPFASGSFLVAGIKLMERVETFPKPVVAAVNGFALGGGCELALACHIRLASEDAIFGQPEINLGVVPGWGGCHRLPRLIGESRATDWLLTGRMVNAREAAEAGLVSKVVPGGDLMEAAQTVAKLLAGKSPVALRALLRAVHQRATHPESGKSLEAEAFAEAAASQDAREGIAAFLEKRDPRFMGK